MPTYKQWVSEALQTGKYENYDRTFRDVLSLKASHNLEESLEFFPAHNAQLLNFYTRDRSISMWIPVKYPLEAPIVYINGSYMSFPSANLETTFSLALRPNLPPKLPPKIPNELESALKAPSVPSNHIASITSSDQYASRKYTCQQNVSHQNTPQLYNSSQAQYNLDQGNTLPYQKDESRQDLQTFYSVQCTKPAPPVKPTPSVKPESPLKPAKPAPPIDLMNNVVLESNRFSEKDAFLAELKASLQDCKPLADPQPVFEATKNLLSLETELKSIEKQLETRMQQMEATVSMLQSRTKAAEAVIERADSQLVPPAWHELINVADKPLEEARAADLAISELLVLLSKALDSGSIGMHIYLRLVRQFAREQFGHRYLLHMPPPRPPKPELPSN